VPLKALELVLAAPLPHGLAEAEGVPIVGRARLKEELVTICSDHLGHKGSFHAPTASSSAE